MPQFTLISAEFFRADDDRLRITWPQASYVPATAHIFIRVALAISNLMTH